MSTDSPALPSSLPVSDHPLLQPLNIGGLTIENRLMVAPMAGVTDNPFRRLCKSFGAGHAVSEMIIADTALYARKSPCIVPILTMKLRLYQRKLQGLSLIN